MARARTKKSALPVLKESYDERALYPWLDIRTAYIEGYEDEDGTWIWPSTRQLSERYNTPETSLANKATRERWADYRKAHQNQIALERQREHARILAHKAVKFDEDTIETAIFANKLIDDRLHELVELQGVMLENRQLLIDRMRIDGEFVTPGQLKASAISGAELESLAKAFALFVETGRRALGIKDGEVPTQPTNTQITQINIRDELLRPDKDKAAAIARILSNANFTLSQYLNREEQEIIEAEIVPELEDGKTEDENGSE